MKKYICFLKYVLGLTIFLASINGVYAADNYAGQSDTVTKQQVEKTQTDTNTIQLQEGQIDINTATAEQLTTLKGIGTAKAAAIVRYREENGAFTSLEGLLEVKGIGVATLEKNKAIIFVGKAEE